MNNSRSFFLNFLKIEFLFNGGVEILGVKRNDFFYKFVSIYLGFLKLLDKSLGCYY